MSLAKPSREFFADGPGIELLGQLDALGVPTHVAIIMDGNGRWAASKGLPRIAGHRAGAKAVREAILTALELGLGYLTLYSFSTENWRRPQDEVSGLMGLFVEILERELDNLQQMHVRVRVIGRRDALPSATDKAFRRAEEATADNDALTLVIALNYGARAEITDAIQQIASRVADGALSPSDIAEETVAAHLYTADIPDPELLVRTSGEMRLSNFLLWQVAYSEFVVTQAFWPDFDRHEFLATILEYQSRTRRFGGS